MTKTFDDLTTAALSTIDGFVSGEHNRLTTHNSDLYKVLADIIAIRYAQPKNPVEYGTFLLQRGIKHSATKVMKPHLLVKALFPQDYWATFAAKISLYGQVIAAIEGSNVPLKNVVAWLNKGEDVLGDGKLLKGLAKGKAAYRVLNATAHPHGAEKSAAANDNFIKKYVTIRTDADLSAYLAEGNATLYVGLTNAKGRIELCPLPHDAYEVAAALDLINKPLSVAA